MSQPTQLVAALEREQFLIELKEPLPDGRRVAPFKANDFQSRLDAAVDAETKWHLILKCRQVGISTYIMLRFLLKCLLVEGTKAVIISHERDATARLLRRVHLAIDDLIRRKAVIGGKLVETEYSSKKELTFPHQNSSLYIGTAGQRAFARGDAITDLHGSEVAFWPDAGSLMTGVIGALVGSAEVFLESTANGMGGYFYEQVEKAQNNVGIGLLHFFPWSEFPEYAMTPPVDAVWSGPEVELAERWHLSKKQLWWRRQKLAKYEKQELFQQEFPLSIEEAFIVAGACYFDKPALREESARAVPAVFKGRVEDAGPKAVLHSDDKSGWLSIWTHPRAGTSYLIAVDTSEGLEDGDPMAAVVLNRERLTDDAWIEGHLDPPDAAAALYALGKLYGWPWMAVESNNTGLAVLLELQRLNYPRLYRHVDPDDEEQKRQKLGWRTDARSRPLILSALRTTFKGRSFRPRNLNLYKECSTFCRQTDLKYRANTGSHDDRVLAAAIGIYLHQRLPADPMPGDEAEARRGQSSLYGPNNRPINYGHKTGY